MATLPKRSEKSVSAVTFVCFQLDIALGISVSATGEVSWGSRVFRIIGGRVEKYGKTRLACHGQAMPAAFERSQISLIEIGCAGALRGLLDSITMRAA